MIPIKTTQSACRLTCRLICRLMAALSCALLLGACLFQSNDKVANKEGGGWDDFPNADQNLCGDLTPAQLTAADSLVAKAKSHLDAEAIFVGSDSGQDFSKLKRRDVDSLDAYYTQALAVAPNHCGALFGKAIVTAYSIAQDHAFDSLVNEAEHTDAPVGYALGNLGAQTTDAAPALLEMRRNLAAAPKSLLTHAQEVSETVLLPKIDSAIKSLETVVAHPAFRFAITKGSEGWRLDRGEAAPLLATLKIAKAMIILVAGYEWRLESDEDYPFLSVLRQIHKDDLDSLTPEQKDALDHYTGLLHRGSSFTRIRPGWAARTASIPDLLIQAVDHVEAGLQYGITEAETKVDQSKDPYRVGTDETADVDPADVQNAIKRIDLAKKYLSGEVPMTYAKGQATLRINFRKLFQIDGLQGLLPYFSFYPYPEWNDSLPADAAHPDPRPKGPFYFTDASGVKTLEGLGLGDYADSIPRLAGKVLFPDPTLGGIFPDLNNQNFWSMVDSLRFVHSRVPDGCTTSNPPDDPNFPSPAPAEPCRMPVSPSDLDLLVYYLGMGFF